MEEDRSADKVEYRAIHMDKGPIDEESRTAMIAISSEEPVERSFGMEVLEHSEESIDLLWCYAVIHTMPSLDYYRQIVSIWEEIGPKRIAIQTKVNKQDQIAEDYEQDYLNALVLSKNSLLEPFQNYAIEYEKLERIPASWNLTHLILRRKENGADDQSSE